MLLRAGIDGPGRGFGLHLFLRRHGRGDGMAGRLGPDPRICARGQCGGSRLVRPHRRAAQRPRDKFTARDHGRPANSMGLPAGRRSRRDRERASSLDRGLGHDAIGHRNQGKCDLQRRPRDHQGGGADIVRRGDPADGVRPRSQFPPVHAARLGQPAQFIGCRRARRRGLDLLRLRWVRRGFDRRRGNQKIRNATCRSA